MVDFNCEVPPNANAHAFQQLQQLLHEFLAKQVTLEQVCYNNCGILYKHGVFITVGTENEIPLQGPPLGGRQADPRAKLIFFQDEANTPIQRYSIHK